MTGFLFETNPNQEPDIGIKGCEDIGNTLNNFTQCFARNEPLYHNAPVFYDFYTTDIGVTGKNLMRIKDEQRHKQFTINFQNGDISTAGVNGCDDEHLLRIVLNRLQHLQNGDQACHQWQQAISKLYEALVWLNLRKDYWKEQTAHISY